MTARRGWLKCLWSGHDWLRPPHHGHLFSLTATPADIAATPVCKGACVRCGKSDCRTARRR